MLSRLVSTVILLAWSCAFGATNAGVTYQGRILKPDGTPLSGAATQFKMQIRTPDSNNCLMYEEVQTTDMSHSDGAFSLTINDGSGTRTDSTGLNLDRIFSDSGSFTFDPSTCTAGSSYAPNSSDGRSLVVLFKDETMQTWEPIPAAHINFVPFAFEAKQVQGFNAASLLRVYDSGAYGNISPLSNAQYNALLALANGSSTAYTQAGTLNGSAMPTMSSGQVLGWNGSAWVSEQIGSTQIANSAVSTSQLSSSLTINTSGTLGAAVTTTRDFKIYAASPSTYAIDMQAPALTASYSLVWPLNAGTNGQVLTTDGSGNLSWGAGGTSSQWTTHGSNISYDGGGNVGIGTTSPSALLQVGSGVTSGSASAQLTASGAQATALSLGNSSGQAIGNEVSMDFHPAPTYSATGSIRNVITTLGPQADLVFNAFGSGGNAERMRISGSGNVGIGTTSPANALDVSGSVSVGLPGTASGLSNSLIVGGSIGVGVSTPFTNLANTSSNILDQAGGGVTHGGGSIAWVDNFNGYTAAFSNTGSSSSAYGLLVKTTSTSAATRLLTANAGGTDVLVVNGQGSVGIGTTSPSAKLDVNGTINATAITIGGQPLSASQAMQSSTAGFTFNSNSDTSGTDGGFTFNAGGSPLMTIANNGDTVLNSTSASSSSSTGALVVSGGLGVAGAINAAGNVTSPHIYGSNAASGNLLLDGTSNATPGNVYIAALGGKVGIGTTSPAAALDVVGAINASSDITSGGTFYGTGLSLTGTGATSAANISLKNTNNSGASTVYFKGSSTTKSSIASSYSAGTTDAYLAFFTLGSSSTAERVRIDSLGNVGIGTTAPTARLQIKAGTATAGTAPLKFTGGTLLTTAEDGAMEYDSSSLYYTIGTTRYVIPLNTASGNYSNVSTISNTSGSITMSPMAGNSVIVNSTTVSTSSTTGALVVNGGEGVAGAINASGNITSGGSITAATSAYIPQLYGSSASGGAIRIDGTSNATPGNIYLASLGGNVGVGTTSPRSTFEIKEPSGVTTFTGTGSQGMTISGIANDGDYIGIDFRSGAAGETVNPIARIAAKTSTGGGSIVFGTSGNWGGGVNQTVMTLTNAGYVGIGANAAVAGQQLDVMSNTSTAAATGTVAVSRVSRPNLNSQKYPNTADWAIGSYSSSATSNTRLDLLLDDANNAGSTDMTAMTWQANGLVGIGTTAPAVKLDIEGAGGWPAKTGSTQTGNVRLGYGGQGVLDMGVMNSTGGAWLQSTNSSNLALNYVLALNPNGGNVGIGTDTPQAALDIQTNVTGGNVIPMQRWSWTANSLWNLTLNQRYTTLPSEIDYDFNTWLSGTATTALSMTAGGRVGINDLQPAGVFSVTPMQYNTGTASQSGSTVTGTGTSWTSAMVGSQFVFSNGTSAGTILSVASATSLTVSTSQSVVATNYSIGYTGFNVASTGNVGIGTTSPTANLYIQQTSSSIAPLYIKNLTGDIFTFDSNGVFNYEGAIMFGYDSNIGTKAISSGVNQPLYITSNLNNATAEPIVLKPSGGAGVGIGTTAPQATLDINGFARLKMNSSAPVTCTSTVYGSLAMTSNGKLCSCTSAGWVQTTDGSTTCSW